MEVVVSTATENAMQIAVRVVKRQFSYFFNYNDKFEEVKCYIERLDNTRKRIQHQVNNAEMNAEEIEDDVQHCLKQLDEKIEKYEQFINDEYHSKTRCSIGFFPNNLSLRYRLGRNATKMVEEMEAEELWNKKFDEVSYRVLPSINAALTNTSYESFASREKTINVCMQALEDSTINMIGLYGVGGVGKTTLVKEVAKKAQEKKLFNVVVMANITRNPNIIKIQGQIAEMLGMRLEEESEIVRADRIRKRLNKEKENTLIILDDLWDGLDLNRLGIPISDENDGSQQDVNDISDSSYDKMEKEELSSDFNNMTEENLSEDQKRCKILLTSRRKQVLCNQMDVKERSTFSVGVLNETEGKTLLKRVAGIQIQNLVYDEKAIEIARMCDGLPIALVSIGRTLKNKSSFVWEDVYQQMKKKSFMEGQEPIEFSIKLSYDHLKNEQLKCIFLHCARMGNDALVMDLVKFCIGLGLIQGVHTIGEARNKVNMLIEELKESSLLLESYSSNRFNMHDIVRDVALSISSKEKQMFFMKNGIIDEWPHKDQLERYTAIFLHYCYINDDLPVSIYCPRLEVLHIDNKDQFLKIPDDFFKDMIELRVLILTSFNMPCLPSSIICLSKLRMLSLEKCTLGQNLSIIGELKKLRILTLSGSNIESFPFEFGQLDKLQLLDLSNCSKLSVIPSNVISRINILEELYMRDTLILWEAKEMIQNKNASLSELRNLNQLRNLDLHIQNVSHVPQNLFFDKLDSYKIIIGEFNMLTEGEFKIPDKYEVVKLLVLNLKEGIDIHSETWVKMLFKNVEYLLLGELIDVHDVFYELNVEGFQKLKHLSIVNNIGLQYIINSVERFHPLLAFPKLESLYLYKLYNLEKLCNNQLLEASFCRLKTIKIKSCDKLESLFPFFMVGLLTMLENIEVCDCDSLKDIVAIERQPHTDSDDNIQFPQLRTLTLKSLPAFTCLYTNDKMPCSAQSLEEKGRNRNRDVIVEVEQDDTNSCLSLFNEKISIPKLESLELSSVNIQKIWSDQSQHCFQNLLTLNVTDCDNLKYLLSFSMAVCLVNLQSLSVSECEMMEDIFRPKDDEGTIDYVFPKLKKMEITCMEKLSSIWQPHIGLHSFHSLDSLIIRECHKLVTIFPSFMGQKFQSLQSLTITNCKLVENIFDFEMIPQTSDINETQLHKIVLQNLSNLVSIWKDDTCEILKYNNLQSITVAGSPNLNHLFPLSITNDLENLEFLDVRNCRAMKEIVGSDKGKNENVITFKFPRLNYVSLQSLFELVSFYGRAHTLEWPSLKRLLILRCGKLEGINTDISNSQMKPIGLAAEKVIYNLEYMAMSFREVEWLQNYIINVHRMQNLQTVVLHGLKNVEVLFWLLHRLPNLKRLTLGFCHLKRIWAPASLISREKIGVVMQLQALELKNIWPLEEIGFEHEVLLQRVERLTIQRCTKLKILASSSVSFGYLTYLEVENCMLRSLMTCSTAKTLVQLKTMKVSSCPKLVEIISENEGEEIQEIEFKLLRSLELVSLQNLTSFMNVDKCDLKFPVMENLVVSECPKMTKFSKVQSAPNLQKVQVVATEKDKWYWEGDLNATLKKHFTHQVVPKLKEVILNEKNITLLKDGHSPDLLHKLNYLDLASEDYENKKDSLPFDFLQKVPNLEYLVVRQCFGLKEIFPSKKLDGDHDGILLAGLNKLSLNKLLELESIGLDHPWVKPYTEKLQGLAVIKCPRLERLVNCVTSFINLKQLIVKNCKRMKYLFTFSTAKSLGKLETLRIENCESMKEIIEKEDENGYDEIIFGRLTKLWLYSLPKLVSFYSGNDTLQFSSLQIMRLFKCPNMKTFSQGNTNAPMFYGIKSSSDSDLTFHSDLNMTVESLFHEQGFFEYSKQMILLDYLEMRGFGPVKHVFPSKFFGSLKKLEFDGASKGDTVIPSNVLPYLKSLEELNVHSSDEVQVIFGMDHNSRAKSKETVFHMKKLTLKDLSNLKCILNKNLQGSVSFPNLQELFIDGCGSLVTLFARKLQTLEMQKCDKLVEIVGNEDATTETFVFEFPCLSSLTLYNLTDLSCFYPGKHHLECPQLEILHVAYCPKLNLFKSKIHDSHRQTVAEAPINWLQQQPLFMVEKVAPKLRGLTLNEKNMMLLSDEHVPEVNLTNLNLLRLCFEDDKNEKDSLPFEFMNKVLNLEHLRVQRCFGVKEIFPSQKLQVHDGIPASLKGLTLFELNELESIGFEHPWVSPYSEKLQTLRVVNCPMLQKLGCHAMSFLNLKELYVKDCDRMEYLFTFSTAKCLVKLETLIIKNCESIKEIANIEDEDGCDKIIFGKLTTLRLYSLPRLQSFISGNVTLQFSYLRNATVIDCPNMKTFAERVLNVPRILSIETSLEDSDLFLHNDLPASNTGKSILGRLASFYKQRNRL
ncbi:uncharacterized protein LOC106758543 isoform X2 [Vigna radiata var. radiata]|uniref:Uncharacterized protein LOC106758543 isoform X2 n=1 Tax=Vigna radiata var. radiata TaxID=3916 RepID=A0A3Q0EV54_VIGRR|nr:uncharacterized protein LOC106758543 isoform X2 [Vigna radiata var. radiata]